MMPAGCHNKIRAAEIRKYNGHIAGFRFFDKEGDLLWEMGNTCRYETSEIVLIAENEVIVGVAAKLYPG